MKLPAQTLNRLLQQFKGVSKSNQQDIDNHLSQAIKSHMTDVNKALNEPVVIDLNTGNAEVAIDPTLPFSAISRAAASKGLQYVIGSGDERMEILRNPHTGHITKIVREYRH